MFKNYTLLYSWLYNTEIYLDKCPDDYHIMGSSNMVKSSGQEFKYIYVLYSQLYNYLFIIYPTV